MNYIDFLHMHLTVGKGASLQSVRRTASGYGLNYCCVWRAEFAVVYFSIHCLFTNKSAPVPAWPGAKTGPGNRVKPPYGSTGVLSVMG